MIKKVFFLLMILIVGISQVMMGQSYKSCVTYDPNRTLDEFKDLVLTSKDPFMREVLWLEYAHLANDILKTSAIEGVNTFVVTPDSVGMQWLMGHTVEYENSYYNQEDYLNGVKVGDRLEYHKVAGHRSNWATLRVGDIIPKNGMYAKIFCSNPQKPVFELKRQAVTPTTAPTSSGSSVEGGGIQKSDLPKDLGSSVVVKETEKNEVSPLNLSSGVKKNKTWPWVVGSTALGIVTGFVAHDNNHRWYFWFPKTINTDGSPGGAGKIK